MTVKGQIVAEDRVVTLQVSQPKSGYMPINHNWSQMGKTSFISILMYWINQETGCRPASNQLHFEIEGPARIVGVDNGRQASRERYQAQKNGWFKRKAFHGRGVLLVQSLEQAGQVRVKASARGLETASFDLLVGEAFDCQPVRKSALI